MLWLSGPVYLKTFTILFLRRHLPIYHTQQIITFSLSPQLSFTLNLRLISSGNHSHLGLLAPFHSRFSGSLNLALFSFHITIIITVSLLISHFISYTAYYFQKCLRISLHWVFTFAWLAFTGTLNLLTHLCYYLISTPHMWIFCVTLILFCEEIVSYPYVKYYIWNHVTQDFTSVQNMTISWHQKRIQTNWTFESFSNNWEM